MKKKLIKLLEKVIKKPKEEVGVLFSGGVDSLLIALILKKNNANFMCYFGYVEGLGEPKDLNYAKEIARKYNLKLKIKSIKLNDVPKLISEVTSLISSNNPIQVGVAIPIYLACKKAKEENIKLIFSGTGADELFCGYNKFKKIKNVNKKTKELLLEIKEKDIIRDTNIARKHHLKLITPYLNKKIIEYALSLRRSEKLTETRNKIPIREALKEIKIDKKYYERKKVAAQYGSNSNKALEKLTKLNKFKYKFKYLKSLSEKIGVLYSGGKDSNLALYKMLEKGYKISCLISIIPKNENSYMYQKPNLNILKLQAKALETPIIIKKTNREKEKELIELEEAIIEAKKKYKITGITSGALYSNYQKQRIEKICNKLNLKLYSPLWHMDQEKELIELDKLNFKYILCKIGCYGLNKNWLGKIITKKDIIELKKLNKKIKINIAGEGGEFESLVINSPIFKKKIKIIKSKKNMENEFTGTLEIEKVELKEK